MPYGAPFGKLFAKTTFRQNDYLCSAMRKTVIHIVLVMAILLGWALPAQAQNHIKRAMDRARQEQEALARKQINSEGGDGGAGWMRMLVEHGDTTYLEELAPIFIFGRGGKKNEKEWRDYYKLVWRFARVYPYALAAGDIQHKVDSVIEVNNYGMVKKDRLVEYVQKQLFKNLEKSFRDMTVTQGALLMKLIQRETGQSSYSIIKEYKNGVAAGFWQGVAKLFDNDLKAPYDPTGADAEVEELVHIWHAGEFRNLYRSVFWEDPPEIIVPEIDVSGR